MNTTISKKQKDILQFITAHLEKEKYPPSIREICEAVSLKSTSSVHAHLNRLEESGYIRRASSKTRAIELIRDNDQQEQTFSDNKTTPVPLMGEVVAGDPILSFENMEEVIDVPTEWLHKDHDNFLLRVHGDSMIDAGIFDKDFILSEKCTTAKHGDIVVALVNGEETTVKRLMIKDQIVYLQPENKEYDPIYAEDIQILGKVISLFRLQVI